MTIHVIDASRPLLPTYGEFEDALVLNDRDTVLLAEHSHIAAHGLGAFGIQGGFGSLLLIDGRVYSQLWTAIGAHGTINIGSAGEVIGQQYGIALAGDYQHGRPNVLNNAGLISGKSAGVLLEGERNVISNSGTITGSGGIWTLLIKILVSSLS